MKLTRIAYTFEVKGKSFKVEWTATSHECQWSIVIYSIAVQHNTPSLEFIQSYVSDPFIEHKLEPSLFRSQQLMSERVLYNYN